MKVLGLFLVAAMMVTASAEARSPIHTNYGYSYGAIAYRTLPASYYSSARYQVGTAGGYRNVYDAVDEALAECGAGCGYYSFNNGCSGIAFTAPRYGLIAQHGFVTATVSHRGSGRSTRQEVEHRLRVSCRSNPNVVCVDTFVACTN